MHASAPSRPPGKVYLVGGGPGDPGLITCRGAECLAQAQLVLYDYLVNPQLLELAPAGCPAVCLGRHGQGRMLSVEQAMARAIAAARAGQTVVRLKGGDPVLFGHLAEEAALLEAAGVPYEIVPGITAALALGAFAGIPLTHRELSSAVALVTGHEDAEKPDSSLDWAALARFPGTLVVYMGVTTVEQWSSALLAAGKPPDTPVAVIRRCSWPNQLRLDTTLELVSDLVRSRRLRPPILAVVGPVVGERLDVSWFTERPLSGQRVLLLRPASQSAELSRRLSDLGAEVRVQPVIEIAEPPDWAPLDRLIAELPGVDWLVFSSVNGVQSFCRRLWHNGFDARRLATTHLAAIGPGTEAALAQFQLRANLVPREYRAEGLAEALAPLVYGRRVALLRASRGREVLAESLSAAGARVEQVVAYTRRDLAAAAAAGGESLAAGQFDWVLVTSSAIARSAARLLGQGLRRAALVSISPVTSATLRELGFEPRLEARTYTTEGMVEVLLEATGR